MKKKHDILVDVAKIASARYLTRALLLVKTIIVARVLGPSDYGLVGLVLLVPAYGQWTDLGILGGLVRTLPALGDGDDDSRKRNQWIETGMTSYGLLASIVTLAVLAIAALAEDALARDCLLLAAAIIPAQCVYNFFQNHHRARQEFGIVARSVGVKEMSGLVYTLALIFVMGAQGFFLAMVLAHITAGIYLGVTYHRTGSTFAINLDWARTRALLIAGFPLASTTVLHAFLLSLDRAVMSRTASREVVGHYMVALLVCGLIQYVPTSAGYILFPVLRERAGEGQADAKTLHRYLREPVETVAWVITFFIAGAVLLLPLVPLVLPSYKPGLQSARVLTIFAFFLATNAVTRNHLAALKSYWKPLSLFQLVLTVFTPLAIWGAMRLETGVVGVAFAMGSVYLLYGVGCHVLALRTCELGWRDVAIDVGWTLVPFAYLVSVLVGTDWLLARLSVTGWKSAVAGTLMFVPASLPLLAGLAYRTPVVDSARRVWRSKVARWLP